MCVCVFTNLYYFSCFSRVYRFNWIVLFFCFFTTIAATIMFLCTPRNVLLCLLDYFFAFVIYLSQFDWVFKWWWHAYKQTMQNTKKQRRYCEFGCESIARCVPNWARVHRQKYKMPNWLNQIVPEYIRVNGSDSRSWGSGGSSERKIITALYLYVGIVYLICSVVVLFSAHGASSIGWYCVHVNVARRYMCVDSVVCVCACTRTLVTVWWCTFARAKISEKETTELRLEHGIIILIVWMCLRKHNEVTCAYWCTTTLSLARTHIATFNNLPTSEYCAI